MPKIRVVDAVENNDLEPENNIEQVINETPQEVEEKTEETPKEEDKPKDPPKVRIQELVPCPNCEKLFTQRSLRYNHYKHCTKKYEEPTKRTYKRKPVKVESNIQTDIIEPKTIDEVVENETPKVVENKQSTLHNIVNENKQKNFSTQMNISIQSNMAMKRDKINKMLSKYY